MKDGRSGVTIVILRRETSSLPKTWPAFHLARASGLGSKRQIFTTRKPWVGKDELREKTRAMSPRGWPARPCPSLSARGRAPWPDRARPWYPISFPRQAPTAGTARTAGTHAGRGPPARRPPPARPWRRVGQLLPDLPGQVFLDPGRVAGLALVHRPQPLEATGDLEVRLV